MTNFSDLSDAGAARVIGKIGEVVEATFAMFGIIPPQFVVIADRGHDRKVAIVTNWHKPALADALRQCGDQVEDGLKIQEGCKNN